jgi:hypothetical protein
MARGKPEDRTVPGWVAPGFMLAVLCTIPWTAYLAATLPRTIRVYDRTAWVGFDIGLVIMMGLTGWLAWRGRPRVALAAVATATMLVVDAWFDVLTSRHGIDREIAGAMAIVELSLAGTCLWIAFHASAVVRRRFEYLERRAAAHHREPIEAASPAPGD